MSKVDIGRQWPDKQLMQCLSLRRLQVLQEKGRLPENFWIGGRVRDPQTISSQDGDLTLDVGVEALKAGQIVALLIHRDDLVVVSHVHYRVAKVVETKVLQPAVGFQFNPRWGARNLLWQTFLNKVELSLAGLGLNRVTTPGLVINPGMEPHLHAFRTNWKFGSKELQLYLPTSPELHLKKLLCNDFTDIYEIKPCYRAEELSEHHEPEFHLLEWYRAFAGLAEIQSDVKELVRVFAPETEFVQLSIPEAFKSQLNLDLTPATSRMDLQDLCRREGLDVGSDDTWDDLFNRLMIERIEPSFDPDKGTFVYDYPASQAALANLNDKGWADRFEFYWKGLELANAFSELTDAKEQLRRHRQDQKYRQDHNLEVYPIDRAFISALERGMPPTGGIALGLDRFCMAVYDKKTIQELRLFDFSHQLEAGS